jgi:DNA helicase-2/ATP-dependent DNA helicase PcrA
MENLETSILAGLNPPQREAVETLAGPLLILAGAGSGKTRVVTCRIANLIAHGARPWQILAITFTNKAAGEMRRRVETLLESAGSEPTTGVWLSTFHSFCARLLRREAEALGFSRDFTIYDEDDAKGLLKDILKRLSLDNNQRLTPHKIRQLISNFKNKLTSPADLDGAFFQERVVQQVYQEYDQALRKYQALDLDDLLRHAVLLFRNHPQVLQRYQERFQHILVDEYQDTNGCQYQLVKLLGAQHRNVCATGDPDQSIYAWRGADVHNILSFEQDFPEAKVVKLEQNYRSTQRILKAAGAVIAHNVKRKKKELWSQNPLGQRIACNAAANEQFEAYKIAQLIETEAREGRRFNDIAIFYRTNAQARALEDALRNNIPYQIVGGTTFYERREIKDALAYLRLLANPKDDCSFRRVLNVPRRALGDAVLESIEKYAAEKGLALAETLAGPEGAAFIAGFKPRQRESLQRFAGLLEKLRALPPYPVTPIIKAALEESGLLAALTEEGDRERLENVSELANAAAEFDAENKPEARAPSGPPPEPGAFDGLDELAQQQASLSGFLEKEALLAPTDSFNPEDDRITLMTLHMAKGLEFPVVFITGLEEGLLPLARGKGVDEDGRENQEALEEERRLAYVGMTRAKEKLYLSLALIRKRYGSPERTLPSRFISEIPAELLESKSAPPPAFPGFTPAFSQREPLGERKAKEDFEGFAREEPEVFNDEQEARPRHRESSRRHDPALQVVVNNMLAVHAGGPTAAFSEGDRVRHAKFGTGIVESLSGEGELAKAKVRFREHGIKNLVLSLAKLEKM